ncbi:MAG TPA: protein kinase [Opitutus sp.]|nr:protein kinase [Opitutus sp.]
MNSHPSSEEDLFNRALALPPADRSAWLARECGSDAYLRARLESLLRAHDHAASNMPSAAPGLGETVAAFTPRPEEKAGDLIGRYKLLQQIGEGGCGVVYMAEQTAPVVRRVALKVIKLGMDTKSVIARFEAERQALAMMDHPNIAKVLDAGTTDNGRPFFVMELVRGIPITKYCDENNLPTADRLGLFDQVCHAIQHAHQKGIIHRDIKPSNILVTVNDGKPVPKVIDFGIAKATQGKLTDATVFTAFEQFIGTPAYMSPEQAEMSSLDIDTRSDIYSLGVLLYELLTGRTPFDPKELLQAGLDEMRRQIREVEPVKPSTRLGILEKTALTATAERRRTDPPKLIRLIDGDLDWIVMRCLEKDRTRRYETAVSVAQDIQRHLQHEPIVARPVSAFYRLKKLARRHRLAFAAVVTFAALWLVGTILSTYLATRVVRAENEAEASRAGRDYVDGLIYQLAEQAANRPQGSDRIQPDPPITVRAALDHIVAQLDPADGSPTWFSHGLKNRGVIPETLGEASQILGDYLRAVDLLGKAAAMNRAEFGPDHDRTLKTLELLAAAQQRAGRSTDAAATFDEIYRQRLRRDGPRHGETLGAQIDAAFAALLTGQAERGLPLLESAAATQRAREGDNDPQTFRTDEALARGYRLAGRLDAAIATGEKNLARRRAWLAHDGGWTIDDTLLDLARSYRAAGRFDLALARENEALQFVRSRGEKSSGGFGAFRALVELADTHRAAGQLPDAIRRAREALALGSSVFTATDAGDRHLGRVRLRLASFLCASGESAESESVARAVLAQRPGDVAARLAVGRALLAAKRFADAEPLLTAAYAGLNSDDPPLSDAAPLFITGTLTFVEANHCNPADNARAIATALVRLYESSGDAGKAADWKKKLRDLPPGTGVLFPPTESAEARSRS